jgi:hypothetical protein
MTTTREIPRSDWSGYFDRFTEHHLRRPGRELVTIEVLSPEIGDQVQARSAPLLGIVYDRQSNALEVLLKDADHLAFQPENIWVVEQDDGALVTVEVVKADGTKELLHMHRRSERSA